AAARRRDLELPAGRDPVRGAHVPGDLDGLQLLREPGRHAAGSRRAADLRQPLERLPPQLPRQPGAAHDRPALRELGVVGLRPRPPALRARGVPAPRGPLRELPRPGALPRLGAGAAPAPLRGGALPALPPAEDLVRTAREPLLYRRPRSSAAMAA